MFDGSLGDIDIEVGKKVIHIKAPKSRESLAGFGDTIKPGGIVTITLHEREKTSVDIVPYRIDAISNNDQDPWFRFSGVDGGIHSANYRGDMWKRTFTLCDEGTTKKFHDCIQFQGLYLRAYFVLKKYPGKPRFVLFPASWIAWVGDLGQAITTYHTPYGVLDLSEITRLVKTGFFKDSTMKSKVPIPENFPVNITGK